MRRLHWSAITALLLAAACATNPATGRRQLILMSEAEEIQLGKQADAQVRQQMGVYEDAALQQYVDQIGQRLAQRSHRPHLPWTFTVVDEQAVNAFALPGGFIYLTRGILPFLRSEAELAAVLGHEVGHVDARHSVEAYSNQTLAGGGLAVASIVFPETRPLAGLANLSLGLLFLRHGREAELESDRLGVGYASASGWNPSGMPGLLNTLARLDAATGESRGVPNWALTHPLAADRVAAIADEVAAASGPSATTENPAALERQLDGLVFGDSREDGFVRGRDFLHPILRFAVRFPEGWEVINTAEQVAARRDEEGSAVMLLQVTAGAGGSLSDIARREMAEAGYEHLDGQSTRINGLEAYVGLYQGVSNGVSLGLEVAHIRLNDRLYVLGGVARAGDFSAIRDPVSSAIRSFRPLSTQEANGLQPNRVDFHVVRSGETWESIAAGPGSGTIRPATLAIMNGSDPANPPRAGARIRIVVAG
jgi:predicted Zn-dependent protease